MAIVEVIKSWFGKNKKTTPTPTSVSVTKATQQPTPTTTPVQTVVTVADIEAASNSSDNLATMINNPQVAFSAKQIALQKITDSSLLAQVALKHSIAKIRQQAAEQLHDLAEIEKIVAKVKHSDKGVYRILRKKLDAQEQQHKQQQQVQQQLSKICEDLELLLRSAHNPLFAAKTQSLQQHWQQISQENNTVISESLQQRFDKALLLAQQHIATQQAEQDSQLQQQTLIAAFKNLNQQSLTIDKDLEINELSAQFKKLCQKWQTHTETHPNVTDKALAQQIEQQQKNLAQRLQSLNAIQEQLPLLNQLSAALTDSPLDHHSHEQLQTLLKKLHVLSQDSSTLPAFLLPIIDSFQLSEQALQAYQHAQQKIAPTEKTKTKAKTAPELEQLLEQIAEHFHQGRSREAEQSLRKAQHYAKTHHIFDVRLGNWQQELQKMKDWAGFAVLPKKEALLQQMHQLATQPDTDALTQLDKIKALQAEWQAVGMVHNDAEKDLWQQFKQISQQAYAPCQQYFEQQAAIEANNATHRQALCDELQQYLDNLPETVNWQGHIAILKQAREDWQKYHPVEAKRHKQLQGQFTRIIKALEDKLHAEYAHQESKKQALIQQVSQLLDHDNIYDACQKAKELQATWKTLGSSGHQKDQNLWETFRQHCDALFAKRIALKEAKRAEDAQTIQQAEQLLNELHTLLNTPEYTPQSAQIEPLLTTFQGLFLPKEVNHSLRKRFSGLQKQWQDYLNSQVDLQKQQQLKQVIDALALFDTAEQRVLSQQPVTVDMILEWQALAIPPIFKASLQKRWQSLSNTHRNRDEQVQREQKALDSCLLLELLLDIDSPEHERLARTAKKMALFEQQSYPKTAQEAQNLISQTLNNLLVTSGFSSDIGAQIKARTLAILESPALSRII